MQQLQAQVRIQSEMSELVDQSQLERETDMGTDTETDNADLDSI